MELELLNRNEIDTRILLGNRIVWTGLIEGDEVEIDSISAILINHFAFVDGRYYIVGQDLITGLSYRDDRFEYEDRFYVWKAE